MPSDPIAAEKLSKYPAVLSGSPFKSNPSFGAIPCGDGTTGFRLWAPAQREVILEVDDGRTFALTRTIDGWFEAHLPLQPGTRYRFGVEDCGKAMSIPDPASRAQSDDVHGYSIVVDHVAYDWSHDKWHGRPWHETLILELHAGLMGGFRGVAAKLPDLASLGVTAIELMPISDFPGPRNWGYDGVLPYAPDHVYGTPDDLRNLVDTAHGLGVMVFLDVVYNHFGPDGNYLPIISPTFFRDDVKTPWGSAIDFRRPEVRAYFTDNAIQWVCDYRLDGLRLDAVHAIRDEGWLDEMALAVRAAAGPNRHVHLILENDDNIADHLKATPHRFDAQWNDDAHHLLHVLLTRETEGYYADYADRTSELLARALSEGFAYQGQASKNRGGKPRGTPSEHLPPTAFINCLQNHDQIGNRAMGDRLTTIADTRALQAAIALLLLAPNIPMIFMGEECGSITPFLYFTSHSEELAQTIREGRRKEFSHFESFKAPEAQQKIPDPNSPETFYRSKPQPGPDPAQWRDFYARLISIRRDRIVPHLLGARSADAHSLGSHAVVARWTLGDGSRLSIAANFGDTMAEWIGAPEERNCIFSNSPNAVPGQIAAFCTRVFVDTP